MFWWDNRKVREISVRATDHKPLAHSARSFQVRQHLAVRQRLIDRRENRGVESSLQVIGGAARSPQPVAAQHADRHELREQGLLAEAAAEVSALLHELVVHCQGRLLGENLPRSGQSEALRAEGECSEVILGGQWVDVRKGPICGLQQGLVQ